MSLVTVWFGLVVLCWVLFFVLEGFDFGVGMLTPLIGRDGHERDAAVRTVGPFWDGNEVWLVAAIGVMFAAFPEWYSAVLSGLYLPMVVILLLLAGRGVALEFRGKHDDAAWRRRCEVALALTSAGIAALWGAVLAVFARGLALGADGEVTGSGAGRSLGPLLDPSALVGAVLGVLAAVLMGSTFLALRTTGPLRSRARFLTVLLAGGAVPVAVIAGTGAGWAALVVAAALAVVAFLAWEGREVAAFVVASAAVAGAVVAVFLGGGDVVLASTLDPAWSLTRASAAATDQALRLISVVGVVVLPGVVVYQAFSYWVFRRRVASERVAS